MGSQTNWYSAGGRVSLALVRHAKLLGEAGYDRVTKDNGSKPQFLFKATGAIAITADRGFWARPELRLFFTWAKWNETARQAGVDQGLVFTNYYMQFQNAANFGIQAETWW